VPPQNLFRQPYPPNLWTVPSCKRCNGGFSKDDEYFRLVLTLTEKAKGHPERDAVLPAALRGVNNLRAERFQESLLANVFLMPRFSPSGLYLGHRRAIVFEGRRIDRMASRIIKGLSFELALVAPVSSSVPQCLRNVGFETPSTRAMSASGMP
jgi:hypothetical protein